MFKIHGILTVSSCLLKIQKLIIHDTENVSNKNICFRISFLGRIQNFSWNLYFPTINLVLLKLYYLLANTFAAEIFLLVLLSEVQKHIIKQELHSWIKWSFSTRQREAEIMNCHYDPTWLAGSGSAVTPQRLDCLGLGLMSAKSNKMISSDCVEK